MLLGAVGNVLVRATIIPYLLELQRRAREHGIDVIFISGYRSPAHQARLYAAYKARGFTGTPAAPPGRSLHQSGDAVDFTTRPRSVQNTARVGAIARALGFRWGGDFATPDPNHIDTGRSWEGGH